MRIALNEKCAKNEDTQYSSTGCLHFKRTSAVVLTDCSREM